MNAPEKLANGREEKQKKKDQLQIKVLFSFEGAK
jgi:hypothetical protein